MHVVPVRSVAFRSIRLGRKRVEGRLKRGLFKHIQPDDVIMFTCHGSSFNARVERVCEYDCFRDMLRTEGLRSVLPYGDVVHVQDGVRLYESIYKHDDELMKRRALAGTLADRVIGIKLIHA